MLPVISITLSRNMLLKTKIQKISSNVCGLSISNKMSIVPVKTRIFIGITVIGLITALENMIKLSTASSLWMELAATSVL